MNKVINFQVLLLAVLLIASCNKPQTKDQYLKQFDKFVNRVKENHNQYNKKDWEWADARFEKFSKEYYRQFKGSYTLEDQVKIKSLIVEYYALKNKEDWGDMMRDLIEDDVEDVKSKIQEYFENDANKDLDKLIEGATEIGDSAVKVLEDLIEKIEEKF